jgi:hypothetical protein
MPFRAVRDADNVMGWFPARGGAAIAGREAARKAETMKKIFLGALVAVLVTLGFGLLSATSMNAGAQDCNPYGPDCPTPTQHNGGGGTTTTVVGVSNSSVTTTTVADTAHVDALTVTAAPASDTASPAPAADTKDTSLAFTGGDIGGLVAIAFCLVALGFVVVRTSRRRATD